MKPTYYGANVRIEHRGSGLGGSLVVQRFSPISEGWHDAATFHESASYCYTEAREYASALAAQLHFEE